MSRISRSAEGRVYLMVVGFDELQSPKRPKRPSWIKSRVTDLEDPAYLSLTIHQRGMLNDLCRLAAIMQNRVPDDPRFLSHRLGIAPNNIPKMIAALIDAGFLQRSTGAENTPPDPAPDSLVNVYRRSGEGLEDVCPNSSDAGTEGKQPVTKNMGTPRDPASLSSSPSIEPHTLKGTTAHPADPPRDDVCPHCDGEGCAWCRSEERHNGANPIDWRTTR